MSDDLVPVTGRTGPIRVGVSPGVVPITPGAESIVAIEVANDDNIIRSVQVSDPRAGPVMGDAAAGQRGAVPRRVVHHRPALPAAVGVPRRGPPRGDRGARHHRRPGSGARRVRPPRRAGRAAAAAHRADEHLRRPTRHVHRDDHQPRQLAGRGVRACRRAGGDRRDGLRPGESCRSCRTPSASPAPSCAASARGSARPWCGCSPSASPRSRPAPRWSTRSPRRTPPRRAWPRCSWPSCSGRGSAAG